MKQLSTFSIATMDPSLFFTCRRLSGHWRDWAGRLNAGACFVPCGRRIEQQHWQSSSEACKAGRVASAGFAKPPCIRLQRPTCLLCRARKPACAAAEEKLAQYHRVGEDAGAAGADHDVHFVRVRWANH